MYVCMYIMQAHVTHHLIPPALFLSVSLALLGAVSSGMRSTRSHLLSIDNNITQTVRGRSLLPALRAYPVGQISVLSTSADGLTVVVDLFVSDQGDSDAGATLYADVRSKLVDTLLLAGTSWRALPDGGKGLKLTRCVIPFLPVPMAGSSGSMQAPAWTTSWGVKGAGALVLAFRDSSMPL